MGTRKLSPNRDEAVGKILDGEAIIINLSTGAYFSMIGVGAAIWQAIEEGRTVEEATAAITAAYEVNDDVARADVERLVDELAAQHLIHVEEIAAPAASATAAREFARTVYEAPVLNIYTDMLEMLALDPPMPVIGELPMDWSKEPA
jgi:hypothetical protein